MKTQDMLMLVIGVALVVIAIVITFLPAPPEGQDTAQAEELLRKAIDFGKGKSDYYYYYSESSDGYLLSYSLLDRGDRKMLGLVNPLSEKELYLLENDTILCVDFMNVKRCSSVLNTTNPLLHEYILSLQSKFFDDETIERNAEQMDYFMEKGYVIFSPEVTEKTVSGRGCAEINYVTDLTNITVGEADRFDISLSSPRVFSWTMCIDNRTGEAYHKRFNYTYQGRPHYWEFTLIDHEVYTNKQVIPPENITEGAYDVLLEESEWKSQLQRCYSNEPSGKDRCIANIGLQLKMKSVCELAGERRDRCLVSIVPLTLDETICPTITDAGYRDDCYVELGGGTKNDSYCGYIANASKKEFCQNISKPAEEESGLPNPAAVNCGDRGYDYAIGSNVSGEYGICSYEGLECEEWALFRRECCLTDADCAGGTCDNQTCVGMPEGNTTDMQEFMQYIDVFGEDNKTLNETNETESS